MNHEQALELAAEKMFQDIVGIFEGDGIGDPELWEYDRFSKTVVRAYLAARAESYDGYDLPKVTLPRLLADFDV